MIMFHNQTFRQALYDWDPENHPEAFQRKGLPESPGHQFASLVKANWIKIVESMQNLFARMEFTDRRFVDPQDLISQLGINPAIQQDAQEFSKLFISLLEKSLSHQKKDSVRTMVERLFRGELTYLTTCLNCQQQSARPSQLYELDLALEGNNFLQDCLDDFTKVEQMTGDEQYYCDTCHSKQDATRCCQLTELPPVLHLKLNRFRFILQQGIREKISTEIEFPVELEMAPYHSGPSTLYVLTGVLLHVGQQANHGHYIAHVKEGGSCFVLNDEWVACLEGKTGLQKSQHAYMLVNMRR